MTEHPILMTGPLVRASIEGRKTETRRVIRAFPEAPLAIYDIRDVAPRIVPTDGGRHHAVWRLGDLIDTAVRPRCPYGVPGDLLYVRETWAPNAGSGAARVLFRADYAEAAEYQRWDSWKPAIHMPKEVARLWLRVESIGVERVWDIDEASAKREGVDPVRGEYREGFRAVWDKINAKRGYGWDVNPWVWVVRYSVASATGRGVVK